MNDCIWTDGTDGSRMSCVRPSEQAQLTTSCPKTKGSRSDVDKTSTGANKLRTLAEGEGRARWEQAQPINRCLKVLLCMIMLVMVWMLTYGRKWLV